MEPTVVSKRRRHWDDDSPSSAQQSSILSFFSKAPKNRTCGSRVFPSRKKLKGTDAGATPSRAHSTTFDAAVARVTPVQDKAEPSSQAEASPANNDTCSYPSSQHNNNNNNNATATKTTTTARKNKTPRQQQQLYLDFGQRNFGKQIVCQTCGMLYVHGVAEDIQQHEKICREYREGVSFQLQAKSCRIVEDFGATKKNTTTINNTTTNNKNGERGGFIVEVRPSDSYALRQKVKQAMVVVDKELGFAPSSAIDGVVASTEDEKPKTVFLFVRQKRIVGVMSVQIIREAYPLVPAIDTFTGNRDIQQQQQQQQQQQPQKLERCRIPSRAILGIHKVWVHSTARNQRVASRLLDTARARMVYGTVVPPQLVAFSSPTESGARFAQQYLQRKVSKYLRNEEESALPTLLVYELPL